jgi:hypothetical protein
MMFPFRTPLFGAGPNIPPPPAPSLPVTAGLVAWYDADQEPGADGASLTQITDFSGNNWHAIGGGSTLDYAMMNGLPVFTVGGNVSYAMDAAMMNGASAGSFYAVLVQDQHPPANAPLNGGGGAILDSFTNDTGSSRASHHPYTEGNFYEHFGVATRQTVGLPLFSTIVPFLYNCDVGTGTMTVRQNDTVLVSQSGHTVNFGNKTRYIARSESLGIEHLRGKIAEIIVYDQSHNGTDRGLIVDYLNLKWAVGVSTGWTQVTPGGFDNNTNGWTGYTLRQSIPASVLTDMAGTEMRFLFGAHSGEAVTINKARIGLESGGSSQYAVAPTPITFNGGSASVVIPVGGRVMSDPVTLAYTGTANLAMALFLNGGSSSDWIATSTGSGLSANSYFKSGDDVDTVGALSGYGSLGTHSLFGRIEVR